MTRPTRYFCVCCLSRVSVYIFFLILSARARGMSEREDTKRRRLGGSGGNDDDAASQGIDAFLRLPREMRDEIQARTAPGDSLAARFTRVSRDSHVVFPVEQYDKYVALATEAAVRSFFLRRASERQRGRFSREVDTLYICLPVKGEACAPESAYLSLKVPPEVGLLRELTGIRRLFVRGAANKDLGFLFEALVAGNLTETLEELVMDAGSYSELHWHYTQSVDRYVPMAFPRLKTMHFGVESIKGALRTLVWIDAPAVRYVTVALTLWEHIRRSTADSREPAWPVGPEAAETLNGELDRHFPSARNRYCWGDSGGVPLIAAPAMLAAAEAILAKNDNITALLPMASAELISAMSIPTRAAGAPLTPVEDALREAFAEIPWGLIGFPYHPGGRRPLLFSEEAGLPEYARDAVRGAYLRNPLRVVEYALLRDRYFSVRENHYLSFILQAGNADTLGPGDPRRAAVNFAATYLCDSSNAHLARAAHAIFQTPGAGHQTPQWFVKLAPLMASCSRWGGAALREALKSLGIEGLLDAQGPSIGPYADPGDNRSLTGWEETYIRLVLVRGIWGGARLSAWRQVSGYAMGALRMFTRARVPELLAEDERLARRAWRYFMRQSGSPLDDALMAILLHLSGTYPSVSALVLRGNTGGGMYDEAEQDARSDELAAITARHPGAIQDSLQKLHSAIALIAPMADPATGSDHILAAVRQREEMYRSQFGISVV